MSAQNFDSGKLVSLNIESLSFDNFDRNPGSDIVCVAPVRTIVRREEEIVLIRRVRKVEEIDASLACPVNTTQLSQVQLEGAPPNNKEQELACENQKARVKTKLELNYLLACLEDMHQLFKVTLVI